MTFSRWLGGPHGFFSRSSRMAAAAVVLSLAGRYGNREEMPVKTGSVTGEVDNETQAVAVTLDQRLTLRAPGAWRTQSEWFNKVVFILGGGGDAQLRVEIQSFDAPDAIAADQLAPLIDIPGETDPAIYARAQLSQRIFRYESASDRNARVLVWTRAMVCGRYLRIADFVFQMAPGTWMSPRSEAFVTQAKRVVERAPAEVPA